MTTPTDTDSDLFAGLRVMVDTAFPRKCSTCGRTYQSAEDFFTTTEALDNDKSCLKQSYDEDDSTIVEVYRNCVCGSTLMDTFSDRRDDSAAGLKRRQKFSQLHEYLVDQGMQQEVAREELLKVLSGQGSELLKEYKTPHD